MKLDLTPQSDNDTEVERANIDLNPHQLLPRGIDAGVDSDQSAGNKCLGVGYRHSNLASKSNAIGYYNKETPLRNTLDLL